MDRKQLYYDVVAEQFEVYKKKNKDYGDSFNIGLDKFGPISFVTRLSDKMLRLEQLVENEAMVEDESFGDTAGDMINYCIMYLMWLRSKEAKTGPCFVCGNKAIEIHHTKGSFMCDICRNTEAGVFG